jgi:general secretion pathway protein M
MKMTIHSQLRQPWVPLTILALLVGSVFGYVAVKHLWAQERLAELEPRYARLIGIEASAPALDSVLIERKSLLTRHAYPSSQDVARAGSDAQQRAREIFTKAGLEVSSTQVLPAKAIDGFDRIPMSIRFEGDLPSLQSALVVLPSQSPSLFIEGLNVQTSGNPRPDGAQKLFVQVNLFVMRLRK